VSSTVETLPTPPPAPYGTVATTLAEVLAEHGTHRPQAPAVTDRDGRRTTYAELSESCARLASAIRRAGLQPGDRIAVVARNGLPWVQLLYAASWAGVALVGLNWRLAPGELRTVLADSTAGLLFAEEEFRDLLGDAASDGSTSVVWLDGPQEDFAQWATGGDADDGAALLRREPPRADRVMLQLYTTGTTGSPKGVMLTEANADAMVRTVSPKWLMHDRMRFLAALPFFHVSGITSIVDTVYVGGELVVPAGTGVHEIGAAIAEHRVTHTVLVPTILTSLVHDPATSSYDLASLEVLIYGSAPSGSRLIEEAMAMLPTTAFSQGYGLTETFAGVAIAPLVRHGDVDPRPGTAGRILENCEVRVVDPGTEENVPPGQDGEIWLRTPQRTPGYWRRPEETAAAITADGWFRTGDIGTVDEEGYLFIRDRLKDMIISGGENIYSVEVEAAVSSHPDVLEVAVYGVPHPHWGETVKAVVVRRPGSALTAEELLDHLADRLARYKRPRLIDFADDLPKTGSGKILKRALRDGEPR
jgi:acyl-CoA synthetase (AMP-forming)/AMP-acid ligase II